MRETVHLFPAAPNLLRVAALKGGLERIPNAPHHCRTDTKIVTEVTFTDRAIIGINPGDGRRLCSVRIVDAVERARQRNLK